MLKEILSKKSLNRYVPSIGWMRTYPREWLRDDLVSGLVVGMIMVPVAMAYAQMAGVPPQAGLYSAIVGMTAYAILATSRHMKVTTSSTMSIMSLAVVAPLAAGNPVDFNDLFIRARHHRGRDPARSFLAEAWVHFRFPGKVGHDGVCIRGRLPHRSQPAPKDFWRTRWKR